MKTLSVSKARSELPGLIEHVRRGHGVVVITRHGTPVADLVMHRKRGAGRSAYSLRGLPIAVASDFDAPIPGFVERLGAMIVLDTQAWLWWLHDPVQLSGSARRAIQAAERADGIVVSSISVWEIAVKTALGKLQLPLDIGEWFQRAAAYPNVQIEPLSGEDAIASTRLPGDFHRDPADRIIISVARRHGVPLVTADRLIRSYPHVQCVW